MDLFAIVVFLVMYYLRPQEWTSLFATIHFVQLIMAIAIISLFTRERQFRFADLFRTPHDWAMAFLLAWTIVSSERPIDTLKSIYPLALFYIVIVQTLFNVKRMKTFVGWWTFLIVGVACLALASEFGFDPRGSYDITHGPMKDRLILNLSIFNNPNGLGHSVAPSLAMLYFFCIWKRPLMMKQIGFAFIGLPLWCIYLTVSKGSYLCAAAAIMATATFGRPKAVQVAVVVGAVMLGGAAIYKLPRMNELNKAKSDPAIQGRVAAFTHGLRMLQTTKTGIGYGNWMDNFFHAHKYSKAPHSSYVQIGAELGYPGLFLLYTVLYCNVRTLVTARTTNEDDERIRRTMFVVVFSYIVSSWMVDFGYRPTFFMFTAVVAAFHRHLYGLNRVTEVAAEEAAALPAWRQPLIPGMPQALSPVMAYSGAATAGASPWLGSGSGAVTAQNAEESEAEEGDERAEGEGPAPFWNRLNLFDFSIITVVTFGAVRFWAYLITRM